MTVQVLLRQGEARVTSVRKDDQVTSVEATMTSGGESVTATPEDILDVRPLRVLDLWPLSCP